PRRLRERRRRRVPHAHPHALRAALHRALGGLAPLPGRGQLLSVLAPLSAPSPFYQGEDTSSQSSRLTAVSAFPLAGHIPFVRDWSEFLEYFMRMKEFGIVASMKDFYWDIRPKPEYGTIEIRVCDTPLTVRRAALLAAYAQSLAAWHLEERPLEPSRNTYVVNSYNRFEACRYGFRGTMVDPYVSRKTAIGEDILQTVATIDPHAARP